MISYSATVRRALYTTFAFVTNYLTRLVDAVQQCERQLRANGV